MTTLILEIQAKEQLAEAYRNALPSAKNEINEFINLLLERALLRKKVSHKMFAILDELHDETEANGLTEAVIEPLDQPTSVLDKLNALLDSGVDASYYGDPVAYQRDVRSETVLPFRD